MDKRRLQELVLQNEEAQLKAFKARKRKFWAENPNYKKRKHLIILRANIK